MRFIKLSLFVCAVLSFSSSITAADLRGLIIDSESGQPVPGALVKLIGEDNSAVSDLDGIFRLADIPDKAVEIVITHLSYAVSKETLPALSKGIHQIRLNPVLLQGQDVIVTATRAEKGETPAAFTNISREQIERDYWAQDTPMLLSSATNIFAYSDAGNGLGYSYLKLRGFNQNRVSVMVNGIPLNGAESHEVYWVDLPDFANNVQDIQIQRGVGTSLYGQSALGGTVNLITNDFSAMPALKVETGYGSYNTSKLSISGNSGLIKDSYVFYGRFSKIKSDGYRDNSWLDTYSYFFGIARYDKNMTWKFNTYGGPEKLHLAYKGIAQDQLSTNRKYNELEYEDEIDNFNQPHYEFFHDWQLNDNMTISNTLYYFHGEGYYNQFREDEDLAEYDLGAFYDFDTWNMYTYSDSTFPVEFYASLDSAGNPVADSNGYYALSQTSVDLVRKPWVKEHDWGWIPRMIIEHDKGKLTIGGEMRIHGGHHWSEVIWADVYPNGYEPNHHIHDYMAKSNTFTIYSAESYRILDNLTIMANIQYQSHNYKLESDKRYNVTFDKKYDFFSPRAGAIYKFNDNVHVFFNASMAQRQPAFQYIYDPQDFWSNPVYRPVNFSQNGSEYEYTGDVLVPEKLTDLEFGADFKHSFNNFRLRGDLNLYYMPIKDEIVPYGGTIDDMNLAIAGNADKTVHQGIELTLQSNILEKVSIGGNVSINDDHFVNYTEYVWTDTGYVPVDLSGYRIGGFPEMMANYRASYHFDKLAAGIGGRFVGKQFLDNAEENELDSFHILDADLSYDFGRFVGFNSLIVTLRINNLLDTEYEQSGYVDWNDNQPRFMVGAERNMFVSLATEF